MQSHVWVKLDARIERTTAAAVLIGTTWIPKSVIRSLEYDEGGDSKEIRMGHKVRTVCVPEWFAEKEDLSY